MRKTLIISLLTFICLIIVSERRVFAQELDKVFLEKQFMEGLATYDVQTPRTTPQNLTRLGKDMYVSDNGCYETESVRNVAFFQKELFRYVPVRDTLLPIESVTTLLTGFTEGSNYSVLLTQHRYNYETVEVEVPLSHLLGYCMSSGFIPYVGVESVEGDIIAASLFMVNESAGFCHTFNFVIAKSLLAKDKGTMIASAYTFTPIHNLKR